MIPVLLFVFGLVIPIFSRNNIDVNTIIGTVRGHKVQVLNKTINEFLGIPYAKPPVGELRFRKPVPIEKPFKDIIDATNPKYSCYQNWDFVMPLEQNEDCLTLNIWAPPFSQNNSTALKPVMFWIYGGSLRVGSIFWFFNNGTALATHDVVVVYVNYRLGPFGWLYGNSESAPGNMGLYDQLLGLKWIRQNIHKFGGDSNQITIFGESAGSWSVSAHVLSPLSRGLFRRAILQSGAVFGNRDERQLTKETALSEAKTLANTFNCTDDQQWVQCLRDVDAKQLTKYLNLQPYPIHDTEFLPLSAQNAFKTGNYSTEIDIMSGVMQDEGSLLAHMYYPKSDSLVSKQEFTDLVKKVAIPRLDAQRITDFYLIGVNTTNTTALKHAFWRFYGDLRIACPTFLFAREFARHSSPTQRSIYFYEWTYPSHMLAPVLSCTPEMGVCHASELEYVFGDVVLHNTSDSMFSEDVMKMWTNFAKYGNPVYGSSMDKWPQLLGNGIKRLNTMSKIREINPKIHDHIIYNLFAKSCDSFWSDYFGTKPILRGKGIKIQHKLNLPIDRIMG